MEQYNSVLNKCALFRGVDQTVYSHLMDCLSAKVKHYNEEEYLFLAGEKIDHVGIVFQVKYRYKKRI